MAEDRPAAPPQRAVGLEDALLRGDRGRGRRWGVAVGRRGEEGGEREAGALPVERGEADGADSAVVRGEVYSEQEEDREPGGGGGGDAPDDEGAGLVRSHWVSFEVQGSAEKRELAGEVGAHTSIPSNEMTVSCEASFCDGVSRPSSCIPGRAKTAGGRNA